MGDLEPRVECPQCGRDYDARHVEQTIMEGEPHFWCMNPECPDLPFPMDENLQDGVSVHLEESP